MTPREPPGLRGILVIDGTAYETRLTRAARPARRRLRDPRTVRAYLPGVIQQVHVTPGQPVRRGDRIAVLEAMKMQNDVRAPDAGVVRTVHVAPGDTVTKDQVLVELE